MQTPEKIGERTAPTRFTSPGHHLRPPRPPSHPQKMLQAAFRAPAARSFAYQSVRALASKPPPPPNNANVNRQQAAPTNPPPPPPSPSEANLEDPQPLAGSSVVPSLDFDPEGPDAQDAKRERTGAKSSKDSLSSIERRRRFMGRVSLAMMLVGAGAMTWFAGRPWEEDEMRAKRMVRVLGPPPHDACSPLGERRR